MFAPVWVLLNMTPFNQLRTPRRPNSVEKLTDRFGNHITFDFSILRGIWLRSDTFLWCRLKRTDHIATSSRRWTVHLPRLPLGAFLLGHSHTCPLPFR